MNDEYVYDDLAIFMATCTLDMDYSAYSAEELARMRRYYEEQARMAAVSAGVPRDE